MKGIENIHSDYDWANEIAPGIHKIGNWDPAGASEGILFDRGDGHIYFVWTDGFDYGSGVGQIYEITPEEKEIILHWNEGLYSLEDWMRERAKS
jgi:hypothetical protein